MCLTFYSDEDSLKAVKGSIFTRKKPEEVIAMDYKMPPLELLPSDVFHDLEKIFNQEESFADVKFEIEGQAPILCHKVILRYEE